MSIAKPSSESRRAAAELTRAAARTARLHQLVKVSHRHKFFLSDSESEVKYEAQDGDNKKYQGHKLIYVDRSSEFATGVTNCVAIIGPNLKPKYENHMHLVGKLPDTLIRRFLKGDPDVKMRRTYQRKE